MSFYIKVCATLGFPSGAVVKNPPANAGATGDAGLISGWGRSPGQKKWKPIAVFLPGKFHGHRSLVNYSPLGCKQSDTPERLSMHTRVHLYKKGQYLALTTTAYAFPEGQIL